MYDTYLLLHAASGGTALVSCFLAVFSRLFSWPHAVHQWSGRLFFAGMTGVFGTTLILTALKPNTFLLLIGLFSYYFAWTGWRLAKNRSGAVTSLDQAVPVLMAVCAVAMVAYGFWLLLRQQNSGTWSVLVIFGLVAVAQAVKDFRALKRGPVIGKARIAAHLQMMLAASIAAITAFLVVNVELSNPFLLWLGPTMVITPIISWWSRRVAEGRYEDPS